MTQSEINEAEWQNRQNWYCLQSFYYAPNDTRVWVPKPIKWTGWTFNFAHPGAYGWLAALLTPALITILLILLTAD